MPFGNPVLQDKIGMPSNEFWPLLPFFILRTRYAYAPLRPPACDSVCTTEPNEVVLKPAAQKPAVQSKQSTVESVPAFFFLLFGFN